MIKGGVINPAVVLRNVVKYEGSHKRTQLPKTPYLRTSENPPSTHLGE